MLASSDANKIFQLYEIGTAYTVVTLTTIDTGISDHAGKTRFL